MTPPAGPQSRTDEQGHVTTYLYNEANETLEEADAFRFSTSYVRDALGREVETKSATGSITKSFYDAQGNKTKQLMLTEMCKVMSLILRID